MQLEKFVLQTFELASLDNHEARFVFIIFIYLLLSIIIIIYYLSIIIYHLYLYVSVYLSQV